MAVGDVIFNAKLNTKPLEKEVKKVEGMKVKSPFSKIKEDFTFFSAGFKASAQHMKEAQKEVLGYAKVYEDLVEQGKAFKASMDSMIGGPTLSQQEDWQKLSEKIQQAEADMKEASNYMKHAERGFNARNLFGKVFGRIRELGAKVLQVTKGFLNLGKSARGAGHSVSNGLGQGIKRMLGMVGAGALLYKTFQYVREGMNNLVAYDKNTANSVNTLRNALTGLKNALASAFAPILNVVAPILAKFIGMLTTAANAVASFISALTGKKFAVVSSGVADGISGIGDSASGANDSAKELQRTLMGFDKINKLDSNSGGGSGGGGGGGGAGGGGGFDLVPVGDEANKWADKFKESWEKADFYWLGELLADKMNDALAKIPWSKIQGNARKLGDSLATFLNGFIENANWNLVGSTIANALNTAVYFAQNFVHRFNWGALGDAVANTINGFVEDADWAAIGDTIGTAIYGLMTSISNFLKKTDWEAVGSAVVEAIANIKWADIFKKAIEIVGDIGTAVFNLLKGAISTAHDKLKSWIDSGKIWDDLFEIAKKAVEITVDLVKGAWGLLKELVGLVADVAISLIKSGWKAFTDLIFGSGKKEGSANVGISLIQSGWKKVKDWINSFGTDNVNRGVGLYKAFGKGADTVKGFINKIADPKQEGVNRSVGLYEAFGKGVDTVKGFINKIADSKQEGVSRSVGLSKAFGKGIATVKGFINSFGTDGVSRGVELFRDFGRGIKTAGAWVKSLGGTAVSVGVSLFKSGWSSLKSFFGLKNGGLVTKNGFKMFGNGGFPRYGSGGVPNGSQLFWAREAGPELVGTMGSHTAVMNNDQIVASVSSGVAKAIAGIRFKMSAPPLAVTSKEASSQNKTDNVDNRQMIDLLTQILKAINAQDTNVYLDGEQIKNSVVRRINNHTRATGQFELVV